MTHRGKEFLYAMGMAVVDNACCGAGTWQFLNVPGYIISWKEKNNADGFPVSEVESIRNEDEQREIRERLKVNFPDAQVNFI
ncbi:MAG: hypothetical protein WC560_11210 [Syntrophales bacterium]